MKQAGNIEQCLLELGYAVVPISGTSMWPLLKAGKSRVQVEAVEEKTLRKGDIVLYRRKDGTLVLHRIMKVKEDAYLVCGDHQWKLEEEIRVNQILAVVQGFFRNGRYVDDTTGWYRLYKVFWNKNLAIRRCLLAFLRLSGLERRG